jgi:hypothetical protein
MADDQIQQTLLRDLALASQSTSQKEPSLGSPAISGQVLASTTAGVRSWVTVALDAVFSHHESVLAGAPVPLSSVDSIFTNPESRLP